MSRPFCGDCPDHEGCMSGYPCEYVKKVNGATQQTIIKLPMVCTCGDERESKVNAWQSRVATHYFGEKPPAGTDIATVMIYALSQVDVSINSIYADQWMSVKAYEEVPEGPGRTWSVQADRLTDALCAIYAAVCMGWDGTGKPWLY